MVVGAVAQVGEDVLGLRKRRLADPWHALAAHVSEGRGRAIHPDRHDVAADPCGRAAALRDVGRGVVRAARAEVGDAVERDLRLVERSFLGVDPVDARAQLLHGARMKLQSLDPLRDHPRDHRRRELGVRWQQPVAVRPYPFAFLVELADHARPHVVAPVVELLLQLVLDDLALFFHHQDLGEPLGEVTHAFGLERPGHRDLEKPDADLGGLALVDAQVFQRLAHVEVALAAGDDAQPRLRRIDDDAVQLVDAAVVERRVDLVVLHPRLGGEERIGPANRHAIDRQREIVGDDDVHAGRVDRDRGGALHRVGDALETDPAARIAAHRPAVQAEIQYLLHRGGIEHGDHRRRELMIRLMRQRRGLGRVVVAREHQHAAVLGRACEIGVLEHVAAAIHAGAFAVPHREYAIDLGVGIEVDLLAAPDRRRGEVFVQTRLKPDVGAIEKSLRLPQRQVERAERRPAVSGDEATGIEARELVALPLQHEEPHERLRPGQEDAAGFKLVFVVEGDLAQRFSHGSPPSGWGACDCCTAARTRPCGPAGRPSMMLQEIVFLDAAGTIHMVPQRRKQAIVSPPRERGGFYAFR